MDARDELKRALQDSRPTLIEFYSPSCAHCQEMAPVVERLREAEGGKANIVQVNADEYPEIAKEYGAKHFPAWYVYKDGTQFWHDNGRKPEAELADMLRRVE